MSPCLYGSLFSSYPCTRCTMLGRVQASLVSFTVLAWRCNMIGCMGQFGNGPRSERFGTRLAECRGYWGGTGPVTKVI